MKNLINWDSSAGIYSAEKLKLLPLKTRDKTSGNLLAAPWNFINPCQGDKINPWEVCESCIFHSGFISVGAFYFGHECPDFVSGSPGVAMAVSCLSAAVLAPVWRVWSLAEPPAENARCCHIFPVINHSPTSHLQKWVNISWIFFFFFKNLRTLFISAQLHHSQDELSFYLRFVFCVCAINYLSRLIFS